MASDMENREIDMLCWQKNIYAILLLLVATKKNENRLIFLEYPALCFLCVSVFLKYIN